MSKLTYGSVFAHAQKATLKAVNILKPEFKFSNFVGLLNGLSPDDNLAPVTLSLISEILSIGLCSGSHKFSHSDDDFTDGVKITPTISVDQQKFELLHFLEVISHLESNFEVWIERVANLFSLTDLDPLCKAFFVHNTPRITLTESV